MVYLVAILIYLLLLTGVGIWKSRQVRTEADFSVAGRRLSPWILVCTMLAAWIGTGSVVGNAGKTYETGLAAAGQCARNDNSDTDRPHAAIETSVQPLVRIPRAHFER